ncbi:CheR family methyltransferase [Paracoccus methylarcula]|uniref:Chemotaxis protein methyltransferase n=1 Tax=Paracoccus methylarcula TaxID=72022 RepID=A0A422QTK1_9RHOB|nr:CheR family methyltransferase [Paracoccus methylarcula]RNF33323.1 methyltransferase domain-containing protein [Paracoccus methylarcula]
MHPIAEPVLSDSQFLKLAEIVRQDSGIVLTTAKRGLMVARLNRRLRALRLPDYQAYCDRLEGMDGPAERRHLMSAITTNVTAFFREAHHFRSLATEILPPLAAKAKAGRRLRLWSAACSSGEEAYSIAITLLETFPDAARHDVRILASDIDPGMIARAAAGRYARDGLRPVGVRRLQRFFTRDGESCTVRDELRGIMRFAELNLHDPWPFSGRFDVIFCRNAVIYFETGARQRLWQRFARQIAPGGYLFIGHCERLDGPAADLFEPAGATCYRRNSTPPPPLP